MDKSTIYSKTGKGLLEVKNRSKSLSKDLFKLLNFVDGKSAFSDLQEKLGRISDKDLLVQLRQLSDLGFVKEVISTSPVELPPPTTSYVDDL
ncbi:MAG: winged helix-turn-helix transcriptional regulator, partial [Burkholderiales bacterium]|nr:winged helix-turn-helix transcriptional regulator [Burkholderiales bacterium]